MILNSKKQPLYDQLVDLLRDRIQGEMKPGDILPSERELSACYGLSRTTVRLALRKLEDLGLIYKKHGKGSIVIDAEAHTADLSLAYSFSDHMRHIGRVPATTVLSFDVIEATKFLVKNMGVALGEKVYCLRRLRSADGIPLMLETTYMPARVFSMLTRSHIESKSLYAIFEDDYNQHIKVAEEQFCASIVRFDDAALLGVGEGSPALFMERKTYNHNDAIIEFTLSIARADQFKYTISHKKG